MDKAVREIRAEDINPRFNWGRALPALGIMGVDFEERVDYRRLHRYRLARVRQALEKSDLGALLVFDVNNIRYLTSTKIGEWERDKLSRWALLPRGGAVQQRDLVGGLDLARLQHHLLAVGDLEAGLLQFEHHRRLDDVDADRHVDHSGLADQRGDLAGMLGHQSERR